MARYLLSKYMSAGTTEDDTLAKVRSPRTTTLSLTAKSAFRSMPNTFHELLGVCRATKMTMVWGSVGCGLLASNPAKRHSCGWMGVQYWPPSLRVDTCMLPLVPAVVVPLALVSLWL